MGGYGALIMATKHPELFSSAAPLSAAIFLDSEIAGMDNTNWNNTFGIVFGKDLIGKDRLNDNYNKNSILKIIEGSNVEELEKVRYFIDCGDGDFLIKGNMALHSVMIDKKIPHEFRVRKGEHNWTTGEHHYQKYSSL